MSSSDSPHPSRGSSCGVSTHARLEHRAKRLTRALGPVSPLPFCIQFEFYIPAVFGIDGLSGAVVAALIDGTELPAPPLPPAPPPSPPMPPPLPADTERILVRPCTRRLLFALLCCLLCFLRCCLLTVPVSSESSRPDAAAP